MSKKPTMPFFLNNNSSMTIYPTPHAGSVPAPPRSMGQGRCGGGGGRGERGPCRATTGGR